MKSDGTVWAWGSGIYGELGNNSTANSPVPVQVVGSGGAGMLTGLAALAGGGNSYSLALRSDGTVWAWGYGLAGELGNNSTDNSSVPVQVVGAGGIGWFSGATTIAAGLSHSLALMSDGTVWAWAPTTRARWAITAQPTVQCPCRWLGWVEWGF